MALMLRGAAFTLVAVLGACAGRSAQDDSPGGSAGASNAGSSGSPAIAGKSSTSGGTETAGASGGGASTSGAAPGGAPTAAGAVGVAGASDGEAGATQGEAGASSGDGGAGPSVDCPAGCTAGSETFCQDGGVTWVCVGPGPSGDQELLDAGCTDLFTQVPRYCCPASFRPECQ